MSPQFHQPAGVVNSRQGIMGDPALRAVWLAPSPIPGVPFYE